MVLRLATIEAVLGTEAVVMFASFQGALVDGAGLVVVAHRIAELGNTAFLHIALKKNTFRSILRLAVSRDNF